MSVTVMGRTAPYAGLSRSFAGAVRVADRIAARTGRRQRIHQVPVRMTGWGHGWHICEVGTCRKEQA